MGSIANGLSWMMARCIWEHTACRVRMACIRARFLPIHLCDSMSHPCSRESCCLSFLLDNHPTLSPSHVLPSSISFLPCPPRHWRCSARPREREREGGRQGRQAGRQGGRPAVHGLPSERAPNSCHTAAVVRKETDASLAVPVVWATAHVPSPCRRPQVHPPPRTRHLPRL